MYKIPWNHSYKFLNFDAGYLVIPCSYSADFTRIGKADGYNFQNVHKKRLAKKGEV